MSEDWGFSVILIVWFVGVLISLGITGFIIWVIWKLVEKFVL